MLDVAFGKKTAFILGKSKVCSLVFQKLLFFSSSSFLLFFLSYHYKSVIIN